MILKLTLFYTIGFAILYLEPIPVAGVSFGILWKLILILLLFLPILYKILKEKYMETFTFLTIVFAFKILISYTSMDYIISTLTLFTKELMLPILYFFFILKSEEETLVFVAKHFSILIIISFIPYMLNILTPLNHGYNLSAYGLENQYGLVGSFMNPHTASISLAFALIVITRHINKDNSKIENSFLLLILFFGLYEILLTYVRTGFVVYIVVGLYLLLKDITIKKIVLLFMLATTLFMGGFYLYKTNDIVRMRLSDKNKYVKEAQPGSGRLQYWNAAIENWLNDEDIVIFIGLGEEYAMDKMEERIGERLFAHNKFFQVLQREGLIGFGLLLAILFSLQSFLSRHKESKYYTTAIAIFIGILTEMMFQGGFYFNVVFLFAIYLALLKKDYINQIKIKGKTNAN